MPTSSVSFRSRKAFTLVELLVGITIVILLASLSIPAVSGVIQAVRMEQGIGALRGYIDLARLEAGAQNRPTEIRFFRDPTNKEAFGHYMALQVFVLKKNSMVPLTDIIRLPAGVAIAADERSSLLEVALGQGTGTGKAASWDYRSFEISPNGENNLPRSSASPPCLALGAEVDLTPSKRATAKLAAVFVDPITSRAGVMGW